MTAESLLFSRSLARSGFRSFVPGSACSGFVSTLLVPEAATLEVLLLLHSSAHLGLFSFAFDCQFLDLLLSIRSSTCLDLTPSLVGLARMSSIFSSSVLDLAFLASFLPAQSSTHLEVLLLALDSTQMEPVLFARRFT